MTIDQKLDKLLVEMATITQWCKSHELLDSERFAQIESKLAWRGSIFKGLFFTVLGFLSAYALTL